MTAGIMTRREWIRTGAMTGAAALLGTQVKAGPVPVKFDRIIEASRALIGWEIVCRSRTGQGRFVMNGVEKSGYDWACAYAQEHYPFPEWSRMITTRGTYPLPVWEPLGPPHEIKASA